MSERNKIINIQHKSKRYSLIFFYLSLSFILIILFFSSLKSNLTSNLALIYGSLIFVFYDFFLWFKKLSEESKIKIYISKFFKIIFLMGLIIITISNLDFITVKFDLDLIQKLSLPLTIITIISGFITFYTNREKIEKDIENEKIEEELSEQKRKIEFPSKFSKINKIPILRNIFQQIHRNGFVYSFCVIFLVIIGSIIRLYKLGELGLWWDELITGTYVTRILEVGVPLFPSELGYYWRGITYHYFVSIFTFLFGNNEFWLRFPSVIFGMGIVLGVFYLAKKINKKIALFILFFLVFSSYNIEYSRFARFYVMNVFLFIVAMPVFYKGFFCNKIKYKFLSIGIFFIMLHTVQTGMIFLSLVSTWCLFHLKDIINVTKPKILFIKNNIVNYLFITLFILIFYLDNIFYKLFKIVHTYDTALNLNLTVEPRSWNFLSWPKFELFKFFDKNYIPMIIIFISLLLFLYSFISKKVFLTKKITFYGLSLFVAIFMFEIGSRGVYGPRIYLFAEALTVMVTFISLYIILKIYIKKTYIINLVLGIIMFFLILNIQPYFFERITLNYGDHVIDDPFRTTSVAAYRADNKTTTEYIYNNMNKDDIVIAVMDTNYPYFKKGSDYILNQNIRWNTDALLDEDEDFISITTKSKLINTPDKIKEIINNNPEKRVWLLVNGASINILETTHVRKNFLKFLEENKDKTVYKSSDNWSIVLLFN